MHPTAAHPAAIMGQAISMAASFWAWAHGRTGAMDTAGVSIASAAAVEEDMLAVMLTQGIVEAARRWYTLAGLAVIPLQLAPMRRQRMVARPMAPLMHRQGIVEAPTPGANRMAVNITTTSD